MKSLFRTLLRMPNPSIKEQWPAYAEVYNFVLDPIIWTNREGVRGHVFEPGIFARVKYGFRSLGGSVIRWWQGRKVLADGLRGKRWLIAGSRNEEESMAFLLENKAFRLVPYNVYESRNVSCPVNWFPRPKVAYLWKYLPFLWAAYRTNPLHFSRVFHMLLHGIGCLENARDVLMRYQPKLVMVSNDHVPTIRAIAVAAKELDIPTAYIQHASIGSDFPPLIFDLSLLDGREAYNRYAARGLERSGTIELVGSAKYDLFAGRINYSTTVRRIGIPYGFYDNPTVVAQTTALLVREFPAMAVTIRPHPRDIRKRPEMVPNDGIRWSLASDENAYEFLAGQDVILSTASGIHLEAALLNVTPLFCVFLAESSQARDTYGFIQAGLSEVILNTDMLVHKIRQLRVDRPSVRNRAAHFVSGIGTDLEGKSQVLVREAIERLLDESPRDRGTST